MGMQTRKTNMNTLVTGGAGFVGRALIGQLITQAVDGHIFLVDDFSRHGAADGIVPIDERLTCINADLSDPKSVMNLPSNVDRVYHLAAVVGVGPVEAEPARVMRVNTLSTLNVFNWFADAGTEGARLLFASTSEVYSGGIMAGLEVPVPTPESVPIVIADPNNPRFSYAATKLWGEMYARFLSSERNVDIVSVRYHNVYGPGMGYDHVIPQVVTRIVNKESPFRLIAGDQTRSFCWVQDAVEATCRVMEANGMISGEVVHIGNPNGEVTIKSLYEAIFAEMKYTPTDVVSENPTAGSVSRRCPDISRLQELTGYQPSTRLEDGLKETIAWYYNDLQTCS